MHGVYIHLGKSLSKVGTLNTCSYIDLCFESFIFCFVQHQAHQQNPPRSLFCFCCRHLIALMGVLVGLFVSDSVSLQVVLGNPQRKELTFLFGCVTNEQQQ